MKIKINEKNYIYNMLDPSNQIYKINKMECIILLSLYDHRWLLFGWPKKLGIFDIHNDIKFSNLFYGIAYIQIQFLAVCLFGYQSSDIPKIISLDNIF